MIDWETRAKVAEESLKQAKTIINALILQYGEVTGPNSRIAKVNFFNLELEKCYSLSSFRDYKIRQEVFALSMGQ